MKRPYLLIALALLFCSCTPKYIRVHVIDTTDIADFPKPDIVSSPSFVEIRPKIKNVLITLPNEADTFVVEPNAPVNRDALIYKSNSIWIAELEKLLTKEGFKVLAVQNSPGRLTNKEEKDVVESARSVGADAIIQINSIVCQEQPIKLGETKTTNLEYYASDKYGTQLDKISATESERKDIWEILNSKEQLNAVGQTSAIRGKLNLKIIYAATGEVIWFYSGNYFYKISNLNNLVYWYLFSDAPTSGPGFLSHLGIVKPQIPGGNFETEKAAALDSETVTKRYQGNSFDQEDYRMVIVKKLFEDFIKHFLARG